MRPASQISRTVEQHRDYQARQRQRTLAELLALLRRARDERAEWYVWVAEGRPELTPERYDEVTARSRPARSPARGARP